MPTPARALAFRILTDAEAGGRTLAESLATPEAEALPARERAFLHELVLGTLRRRGAIDHALVPLLDRPLARLDSSVRTALRLAAHQILHLRVPGRAAVTESVDLVRAKNAHAAGFANAVLRRLVREGPPGPPDPERDPRGWLTTIGSLPPWLAERWLNRLGAVKAVARARAQLETPPVTYRLNPQVADAEARAEAAGLAPKPATVPGAWNATSGRPTALAAEGLLYLQDQGSQLIARLAAGPGWRLDACAAPGGKTLLMSDLAGKEGTVVAAEAKDRRLRALAAVVARWRVSNVRIVGADGLRLPFRAGFAGVLLDAPCSGLGTLSRHPDIRWRARETELPKHARLQAALLESLAAVVARGGLLVYAVCSVEPEETEEVVRPFLEAHPDFTHIPAPGWARPFVEGPYLRTDPERHGGDAFFAASLLRA